MTAARGIRNPAWRATVLGVAIALTGACSSPFGGDEEGDILLRVANESPVTFDRTFVHLPEDQVEFGALAANQVSDYVRVSAAYRYAYILVEVGDTDYVLQPIDYVGEEPLGPGKYTYALEPSTTPGYLIFSFRKDD